MTDALGRPRSVLVLGGSSEIAAATVRRLVARGAQRVVLLGRDQGRMLDANVLGPASNAEVHTAHFDAANLKAAVCAIDDAFRSHGDFDVVLLAFGVMDGQERYERDPLLAGDHSAINFAGTVASGLAVSRHLFDQGHGTLVLMSSVAGQRPRRANFVYGAAKSGLDSFARGLLESLRGSGVRVMIVRPGFVRTRMTAGLPEAPFAQSADDVARSIVGGLDRNADIVWSPSRLRWLFLILRLLPQSVFRRLER